MERIQLRFTIKENSPLENVLKPKTGFNPGNAKHAFLTELSLFSSELFSSGLTDRQRGFCPSCRCTRCAATQRLRLLQLRQLLRLEQWW